MSYILDALRRAEAERQQGQVPGLHDAPAVAAAAGAPARGSAPRWFWAAPALLLAAGAAWWWWPKPVAVPASAPAPIAPSIAIAQPAPAPAPLPVVVSAPPPPPPAAAASAAATATERPLRFTELSPELQRSLPSLVPSGSVWSDQPAARFVVLNGQVPREGDTVAPGLVLERLQPKSALLRWRGLLIELPL
jgi:general secretion pathway protein B